MTKIIVFGSSDIIDLINNSNLTNYKIIAYISNKKINKLPFKKIKYFGTDKCLSKKKLLNIELINNIYSNKDRKKIYDLAIKKKIILKSVISNNSIRYSNSRIGNSCLIYPFSILSTNSNIGNGNIISYNVIIGHDVKIGHFNFISPGSVILGNVKIGSNCLIGSNVTIMPNVKIGNNVKISAGTTVAKNVKDNSLLISNNQIRTIDER
jgi:sugar O-acyltransferase (sialic acid O-acetyltransferase NeuD family)